MFLTTVTETFAIDRLHILSEIEASFVRNRTYDELKAIVKAQQAKYMPLSISSDKRTLREQTEAERRKDHISHFVLRLAFCRSYVLPIESLCTAPLNLSVGRN